MRKIIIIAHNLRSAHNVGSLLRTADGIGVKTVFLTGYTPYPFLAQDIRLPHLAKKIDLQIHKTALGAESTVAWRYSNDVVDTIRQLKQDSYHIVALEQTPASVALPIFQPPPKVAIVLGREVEGIEPAVLALCDSMVEIPMFGKKESYNVVQAAAMALFHCRFAK